MVMVAGALALLPATAASAADEGATLLSLDGVAFSPAPDGALFPDGLVLVPGSHHTTTFWVRNDSDRAGALRISVSGTTASTAAFIEDLSLQAATPKTADAAAVPLQAGATCTPLLAGELMPPGTVTEVSLTLAMRDAVDNAHQGATANTSLMVSLSDPGAPSTAADCTPGGGIPLTPDPEDPDAPGRTPGPSTPHDGADADPAVSGSGSGGSDGTPDQPASGDGTGAPPADGPPGAAAPPSPQLGSPVLFPWMGVGTAVLAAGIILAIRKRRGQRP
jgi:hypothetical protein